MSERWWQLRAISVAELLDETIRLYRHRILTFLETEEPDLELQAESLTEELRSSPPAGTLPPAEAV